jgi:hypothetical protein
LDISREKISEPASIVKGVSSPRLLAIPILYKETQLAMWEGHLRKGGFTGTGLSSNKDGSSSDFAFSDHAEDDSSSSTGISLHTNSNLATLRNFEKS